MFNTFVRIIFLSFILKNIISVQSNNNNYNYYKFRNMFLRSYIFENENRNKNMLIKKTIYLTNKIISKINEINIEYYSLSEDERNLIDAIISLTF